MGCWVGPLDQIVEQPATCTKKGDLAGVYQTSLRWLSQFLSYEKERIK